MKNRFLPPALLLISLLSVGLVWTGSAVPPPVASADLVTPVLPDDEAEPAPLAPPVVVPNLGPVTITVTNAADNGPGTLRQAILDAAPGDTINFALPLPATIVLTNLQLRIDKNITITGPGAKLLTIQRSTNPGTPNFRLIRILFASNVVHISGLTLNNGRIVTTTTGDNVGGAIYNTGQLTLRGCDIVGNVAPADNAVVGGFGAGVFTVGPLVMEHCNVSSNNASAAGGGINLFPSSRLSITHSTVADNYAGQQGGGINLQGSTGFVQNCTISGNIADGPGRGGGLVNVSFPGEASRLVLDHCTITRNTGLAYNGGLTTFGFTGSRIVSSQLKSTILANNIGTNFTTGGTLTTLSSVGHNLDTDGSSLFPNGFNGDIIGSPSNIIDAQLGPLQFNGGPTPTHALLAGSPALDTGACLDLVGNTVTNDQRGVSRPQGPACDMGASENTLPTVACPSALILECEVGGVACAKLTAVVDDADGDALSVVWSVNGVPRQTNFVAAGSPPTSAGVDFTNCFSLGTNTVVVTVSDGKSTPASCSTTVVVRDTKAPAINHISVTPKILWPPNHRMVPVKVSLKTFDACGGGPLDCKIVSVTSNEPVNDLGDGNTAPDWIITGNLTLKLRAERSGLGRGRLYTITVRCTDCAGNSSTRVVRVLVPHSLGDRDHDRAFDDECDRDNDNREIRGGKKD